MFMQKYFYETKITFTKVMEFLIWWNIVRLKYENANYQELIYVDYDTNIKGVQLSCD